MATVNHVHTFKRMRKGLFKCNDPYCTYTAQPALINGKASKCNTCGREIILTPELLQLARPKCIDCRDTKESRMTRKAREIMENLGVK